jgi:hypothetical protein
MISKSSIHFRNYGFTLTELMIAAFISISVVAFGGWGVVAVISSSKTSESHNERHGELNRALDFMAAEIRQSVDVNKDTGTSTPKEFEDSLSGAEVETGSSLQKILWVKSQELPEPVIYYIAKPAATNLTWRGPNVIYRWGPSFDADGNYDVSAATPSDWTHMPLIDAIEDTNSIVTCPAPPPDWESFPPSSATGFYACIKGNKIAQLHLNGRVNKVLGITTPYLAISQAFARTAVPEAPPSVSGGSSSGTITLRGPSTTQMRILGSAIQCGPGGTRVNTQLVVNKVRDGKTVSSDLFTIDPTKDPPTMPDYTQEPVGTSFNFTGSVPPEDQNPANNCGLESKTGAVNSLTNSVQVKILRNGDAVPGVKGFDGSPSVRAYIKGYVDDSETSIKLNINQYIVLFELGETNTNEATFDQQDLVVLATVNPS